MTYKKTEAVQPGEDSKVSRRREPDLQVKNSAVHLGPLEAFFTLVDGAITFLSAQIYRKKRVTYSNRSGEPECVPTHPCSLSAANVFSSSLRNDAVSTLVGKKT